MRKVIFVAVALFLFTASAAGGSVETAEQMFARGEYQEGVRSLKTATANKDLPTAERFAATIRLARLYAREVGDYPRAIRFYRRAIKLSHGKAPLKTLANEAQTELDRIRGLEQKYRELNSTVRQMRVFSFQRTTVGDTRRTGALGANANRLAQITDSEPKDYHRMHEAYYALGLTCLALDRPFGAYRAFDKALAIKPAMNLALPISRLRDKARLQWMRTVSRWTGWTLLGVLIATMGVAAFWSRPWHWCRLHHLATGLVLIALWAGLFFLAHQVTAADDAAARLINSDGVYPVPVYIHTTLGTPGAEVLRRLFAYGLTAIAGTFFFSVAMGRMRNRIRATVIVAAFSLLLSGALATLFYLDHCDDKGRFYAKENGAAGIPGGYLAYPMSDPEPYLLVNPLYYQGLDLSSIDDPVLVQWLESYVDVPKEGH